MAQNAKSGIVDDGFEDCGFVEDDVFYHTAPVTDEVMMMVAFGMQFEFRGIVPELCFCHDAKIRETAQGPVQSCPVDGFAAEFENCMEFFDALGVGVQGVQNASALPGNPVPLPAEHKRDRLSGHGFIIANHLQ